MQKRRLLKRDYRLKLGEITEKEREFREVYSKGTEEQIFSELLFCLLTPQSKAENCWQAVVELKRSGFFTGAADDQIPGIITCARFKNKKSCYIIGAREQFLKNGRIQIRSLLKRFPAPRSAREYLVKNVKGLGYKEASHFLRNIGMGGDLAILDRHVLKNLEDFGVIRRAPENITPGAYLETEKRMEAFAGQVRIPMGHLDMLFWFRGTGRIFK